MKAPIEYTTYDDISCIICLILSFGWLLWLIWTMCKNSKK